MTIYLTSKFSAPGIVLPIEPDAADAEEIQQLCGSTSMASSFLSFHCHLDDQCWLYKGELGSF